jgi:hypothetical protein
MLKDEMRAARMDAAEALDREGRESEVIRGTFHAAGGLAQHNSVRRHRAP